MIVLFDIGSTLIEGPSIGPVKRIVEYLDLPKIIEPILNDYLFQTDIVSPNELAEYISTNFDCDIQQASKVICELWEVQSKESWVIPGASEILEVMQASDIPYAFVSNIWSPFYQGFLNLLPEHATRCPNFLSFRMGVSKPDLVMYRNVIESLGANPSQTIMVGDTYKNDIAPAMDLGLKTVWLLHRPQKEKADIVDVLNNNLPRPTLTLEDISQLTLRKLQNLLKIDE